VSPHHHGVVAQCGHIGRTGRRGAEEGADLGHSTGDLHLVVEDVAPSPSSRVALELLVDAGAGGVEEVDERDSGLVRYLLGTDDLLEGSLAPGAGLDREVVGDDGHVPAVHAAYAGDDGITRQALVETSRQAVLERPALIEK